MDTDDNTMAIISANQYTKDPKTNRDNYLKLKRMAKQYGYSETLSRWVEPTKDNEKTIQSDERSFIIHGIPRDRAIEWGKMFGQWSIIFKDDTGCFEICTKDGYTVKGKTLKSGEIVRTFKTNGRHILNLDTARRIFGGEQSGSSSLPIKSTRPFTLGERVLDSVFLVEPPRPSYFQTGETLIRVL